jgi:hypothetical protein
MKGTNVAMELLAKVALETNGFNDIVDPTKLDQNFNFILQNPIVATNVKMKMVIFVLPFISLETFSLLKQILH